MIKSIKFLLLASLFFLVTQVRADEGMWIPLFLKKYNIEQMQAKGFKLTAEDIYSVNQACMKDAVVIFGGGCTGELISKDGLILTNHHCGYGSIQRHSTVEHDYLTDGFWAMSRDEELPNPGLSVTFLIRMEDVTDAVFEGITEDMEDADRNAKINGNTNKIRKEAVDGTDYTARVAPFFQGNQYFLFVYESYNDVRLVGAPPSAIGKFGGDTDNWMWPRHTGDFSLFRVYADKDNKPAVYSEDNVPYHPKKHFPISVKGYKEGDFTMIFGYPGSTRQYIPSYAVRQVVEVSDPYMISLRDSRLEIIAAAMEKGPKTRIQYSAKSAGLANGWKKAQGEIRGLKRLNAISKKEAQEKEFEKWLAQTPERTRKYGNLLSEYKELIEELMPLTKAGIYSREAGYAAEIIRFSSQFRRLTQLDKDIDEESLEKIKAQMQGRINSFFRNYDRPTDMALFKELTARYINEIEPEFLPEMYKELAENYQGDYQKMTEDFYSKTIFDDQEKLEAFVEKFKPKWGKKILKDPAYMLYQSISELNREKISPVSRKNSARIADLNRLYMAGLMEMNPNKVFYPDANFTLRVAYGEVGGYEPKDGVIYDYYTTLDGIMKKDNPEIYDYKVPQKLKDLHKTKDYGMYAEDGDIRVCFVANNHTSGGNSGSPVINAEGHLIGVNFDRCWEGTMSDIMFDPDQCRNIMLDIRYVLFLIDKFAGAGHLVDELTLIK